MQSKRAQKIIFVTGKGGVGKSVVALAMAQMHARNQKVLLVELGLRSFYSDFLAIQVGYQPISWKANLDIALWSGPECLREYALYLLKLESLYKLFFDNRISRTLIEVAPALSELSILGKITSGIRQVGPPLEYDVIVVDGYATGHMLALLRAPRGMNEAIRLGPMADQTRSMLDVLRHPEQCQYCIVTLPEELPAIEADELYREIVDEVGIKPSIICNKVWPQTEIESLQKDSEKRSSLKGEENSSTAMAELAFARALNDLVHRQQAWIHYLEHRHESVKCLSMEFTSEAQRLIDALEDQLK